MYSGQDASNGMQSVGMQQPIVFDGGPVVLAPNTKESKRWPWIVAVASILIIITIIIIVTIFKNQEAQRVAIKEATNNYIEYFIYGTEREHDVNADIFDVDAEEYVALEQMRNESSEESTEFFDTLFSKYDELVRISKNENNKNILNHNENFLEFYRAISQTLYSDLLLESYNNDILSEELYENLPVGDDEFLMDVYDVLKIYANDQYKFYEQVEGWGCLADGSVDYDCILELGKEDEIFQGDLENLKVLYGYEGVFYNTLVENLNELYKQGGENEQ